MVHRHRGDGYGDPGTETAACSQPSGTIADGNDCNDGININGATETCDGVDDNCSGDENDATDATTWYADIDDDKFGDPDTQNACSRPSGYRPTNTDCMTRTQTSIPVSLTSATASMTTAPAMNPMLTMR